MSIINKPPCIERLESWTINKLNFVSLAPMFTSNERAHVADSRPVIILAVSRYITRIANNAD